MRGKFKPASPIGGSKTKGKEEIQANELKAQLARALADYDNLRKRTQVEIEDKVRLAKARLTLKFISIFDMLEEAQEHLKDGGLAITIKEFENLMSELKAIANAVGRDI